MPPALMRNRPILCSSPEGAMICRPRAMPASTKKKARGFFSPSLIRACTRGLRRQKVLPITVSIPPEMIFCNRSSTTTLPTAIRVRISSSSVVSTPCMFLRRFSTNCGIAMVSIDIPNCPPKRTLHFISRKIYYIICKGPCQCSGALMVVVVQMGRNTVKIAFPRRNVRTVAEVQLVVRAKV